MKVVYPTLVGEMAKRGVKKSVVASALEINPRTLYSKMQGKVPFTWPEVQTINQRFFPDMNPYVLFAKAEEKTSPAEATAEEVAEIIAGKLQESLSASHILAE